MQGNSKGDASPEIPSSTWAFMALARDVLDVAGLNRVFGVEKSQISRWTKNPDIFDDAQRNPIDRLRLLFERMVEAGEGPAVEAMLSELASPLGKPLDFVQPPIPEHEGILDELLDIPPAVTEHAQTIRQGRDIRTVEHWEHEAIREIREATQAYRRSEKG